MMEHINIFTLCLMTDALGIINLFSLVLQKKEREFTDLKVILESNVTTSESLPSTMSSEKFENIISLSNTQKQK